VMPGVLQLEALAQAGALLAEGVKPFDASKKVIYLLGFDAVRFRRVVTPGDKLELHVKVLKRKGPIWKLAGEAKVDGEIAAEAEILATIADKK
jgi:3-hydroxyacyl-[acyl-carrier-protein] dehydratase